MYFLVYTNFVSQTLFLQKLKKKKKYPLELIIVVAFTDYWADSYSLFEVKAMIKTQLLKKVKHTVVMQIKNGAVSAIDW